MQLTVHNRPVPRPKERSRAFMRCLHPRTMDRLLRRTSENSSSETVRKGYEQRSNRRFGWYTEAKMDQKVPFRWPVRLHCRPVRDFSDSFGTRILGSRVIQAHYPDTPMHSGSRPYRRTHVEDTGHRSAARRARIARDGRADAIAVLHTTGHIG